MAVSLPQAVRLGTVEPGPRRGVRRVTWPGSWTCLPLPVPAGRPGRSTATHVQRGTARAAGQPASRAASRSTRRPDGRGLGAAPSTAQAAVAATVGAAPRRRARRARPCPRAAGRRSGPAPRRPRGRARPRAPAAPGAARRTRVKRGSSLCGSSQDSMPSARQAASVCGAGHVEQRAAVARRSARRIPGERPAARAAGEPEQHRLGLVVEGVPEQHHVGVEAAAATSARARRTAPRGPPPPGPSRRRSTSTRTRDGLVDAERAPSARPPRVGVRGGAVLEAVVDGHPDDVPAPARAPRRPSRPAGRASRRRREQATSDGAPGSSVGEPAAYGEPDRGDRGVEATRSDGVSRARGATQAAGSPISALDGRFAGSAQTALKSVHADLVDDARGRRRRRRGTAPSWRPGRAAGAAAGRGSRRPCGAG